MRSLKLACVLIALLLVTGCGRGRRVSFELVATSDIHGNLFPYDYMGATGTPDSGSLARVATWLGEERREYGNRLLYFDLGDQLQGNAMVYYDQTADYSGSSLAAEVLNELGCQASVLGNHDVEAGVPTIDRFTSTASFPVLCGNIFYRDTEYSVYDPYTIIERKGVRIAVVGLTTKYVLCKLPASSFEQQEVMGVEECARELIPYIIENEHPHLIVGLIHSGLEGGQEGDAFVENEALSTAVNVPGFDVVFYGHDHEASVRKVENCQGDSVLLINPGPYALNVARVHVNLRMASGAVAGCSISGELADMSVVKPDDRLTDGFRNRIDAVWHYQDSVAGKVDFTLDGMEAVTGPSMLTDYFGNAIMRCINCEIALSSPYDESLYIPAGNVTMRDLRNIYPYENPVTALMLKGSDVVRILENSSACWMNTIGSPADTLLNIVQSGDGYAFRYRVFDFISAAGINYVVDVTKPAGHRVTVLSMSDGSSFDPDKRYRVGMSSFMASGGSADFCSFAGMSGPELRSLELYSSGADMRFHLITNLTEHSSKGMTFSMQPAGNWKLVPEDLVSEVLERDMNLIRPALQR